MQYQEIAEKIISLKDADLAMRNELIKKGKLWDGYDPEMEKLHMANADSLSKIIDEIGYPTLDKVGPEAHEAAWVIIQHAISKPNFLRKCQILLQEAIDDHRADPLHLAYLSDRISIFEGSKQRYGTQFDWDENGDLSPQPYDDIKAVNDRRAALGLNSLEEQTEIIRARAKAEKELPPKDLEEKRMKMKAWKKKVGWI